MDRYPKPGPTGGSIIRTAITTLREAGVALPVTSHILCAYSGGLDSTALAYLLVRYGRRVGEDIRLLHINHGWRGEEADADEDHCREQAERWGVPIRVVRLNDPDSKYYLPPERVEGHSWEEAARAARKRIYADEVSRSGRGGVVLTAHHGDDLAETLLWRLFTGCAATHGAGILLRDGPELRPFLRLRKQVLRKFLEEEGVKWREDRTNQEGRFLRSRMRRDLMPSLESLFPRAVENLVQAALRLQIAQSSEQAEVEGPAAEEDLGVFLSGACLDAKRSDTLTLAEVLFGAAGLRTRKAHRDILERALHFKPGSDANFEIHLPDQWRLKHQRGPSASSELTKPTKDSSFTERWILEKE